MAEQITDFIPDIRRAFPSLSSDNKEFTLTVNIWNGNAAWTMHAKERRGKPVISLPIPLQHGAAHGASLKKVLAMGPGTSTTRIAQSFVREERKVVRHGTIVFGRDDKNMCYIEIGSTEQPPVRFTLRQTLAWTTEGSDPNQIAVEGSQDVCRFLAGLLTDQLVILSVLSRNKLESFGNQNGGGNGGGGYRGGNSGGGNNSRGNYRGGEQSAREAATSGESDIY